MKTLMTFLFLISSNAFGACPDLVSTTLRCLSTTHQTSGNVDQKISQQTVNGITTYTFNYVSLQTQEEITEVLIADGKARRETQVDPDSGISLLSATTVTCAQNKLLTHTTFFVDGQFLGILDKEITKSGNIITNKIEGALFGRDVSDTLICE